MKYVSKINSDCGTTSVSCLFFYPWEHLGKHFREKSGKRVCLERATLPKPVVTWWVHMYIKYQVFFKTIFKSQLLLIWYNIMLFLRMTHSVFYILNFKQFHSFKKRIWERKHLLFKHVTIYSLDTSSLDVELNSLFWSHLFTWILL